MNFNFALSNTEEQVSEVARAGESLADALESLGNVKKRVYVAERDLKDNLALAIYTEMQKVDSPLKVGKNAEERGAAKDAFEIKLRKGQLKPYVDALDSAIAAKVDAETDVAMWQARFDAIRISIQGLVAILGCKV